LALLTAVIVLSERSVTAHAYEVWVTN